MSNKILFPTDFSNTDHAALDYATKMAIGSNASMLIVHVEEPPAAYGGGEMYYGMPEPDTDTLKQMLKDIVPSNKNVSYEHRLLIGDPASEIVLLAESENVDTIVMGTHGRTGFSRLLMGSVAEAVVRQAKCPVIVIKNPSEKEAPSS